MTKNLIKILALNSLFSHQKNKYTISKLSKHIYTNIHTNLLFTYNTFTYNTKTYTLNINSKNIIIRQTTCKRIHATDVNSLYPFSFINKLPYPKNTNNKPNKEKYLNYYIAKITLPNFERIPFQNYQNIYTPIYTPTHLNYLKSLNYKIKIIKTIRTNYQNNNITDFILYMYKNKQKHYKKTTKLLLNSLYGKLLLREYWNRSKNKTNLLIQTMLTYSQIHIHKKKNIPNNPTCYSDTDSLYTRHIQKTQKRELIGGLKDKLLDNIKIESPRNYEYKINNNKSKEIKGLNYNNNFKDIIRPKNIVQINNIFIIYTFIYQTCCIQVSTNNIYTHIHIQPLKWQS